MPQFALELNHADLTELHRNRNLLSQQQRACLEDTLFRIERFPQRFARTRQAYAQNAGLIIMSEFPHIERFSRCCFERQMLDAKTHRVVKCQPRCNFWQLCPYCCHIKRQDLLRKLLPVFGSRPCFLVTISFSHSLEIQSGRDQCVFAYWGACQYALKTMWLEGIIAGGFVLEDFFIDSYYPIKKVLPHCHAVVLADRIAPEHIDTMGELIRSYTGQVWCSRKRRWLDPGFAGLIEVGPTIFCDHLQALPDFSDALCYCVKPVDFYRPYARLWEEFGPDAAKQAWLFNQNKDDVIFAWQYHREDRYQQYYLGNLHASSSAFIGVNKQERNTPEHREKVSEMLDYVNEAREAGYDSRFNQLV